MDEGTRPQTTSDLWLAVSAPEARRRLLVSAICIIVYVIGTKIPAPGLSTNQMLTLAHGANASEFLWRFSIFALEVNPIFSALILAQLFRLAWPSLTAGAEGTPGSGHRGGSFLLLTALALAAAQGLGLSYALDDLNSAAGSIVSEPGTAFRIGYVVTLVAATAMLYWLAGLITHFGIGSGFWLLLAVPGLSEFWSTGGHVIAAYERHEISLDKIVVLFAAVIAAAAFLLAVARILQAEAGERAPRVLAGTLLWPPIIAGALVGFVAIAAVSLQKYAGLRASGQEFFQIGTVSHSVLFVVLIIVLTFISSEASRCLALLAAAATTLVTLALHVPQTWLQIPLPGVATVIAALLVAFLLLPQNIAAYFPDPQPASPVSPEES